MRLVVHIKPNDIRTKFIKHVILPRIYVYVTKLIRKDIFKQYTKELQTQIQHMLLEHDYLSVTCVPEKFYIIEVDPVRFVSGTDAKLNVLAAILESGNLEYPPMNVFSKVYQLMNIEIPVLYKRYLGG